MYLNNHQPILASLNSPIAMSTKLSLTQRTTIAECKKLNPTWEYASGMDIAKEYVRLMDEAKLATERANQAAAFANRAGQYATNAATFAINSVGHLQQLVLDEAEKTRQELAEQVARGMKKLELNNERTIRKGIEDVSARIQERTDSAVYTIGDAAFDYVENAKMAAGNLEEKDIQKINAKRLALKHQSDEEATLQFLLKEGLQPAWHMDQTHKIPPSALPTTMPSEKIPHHTPAKLNIPAPLVESEIENELENAQVDFESKHERDMCSILVISDKKFTAEGVQMNKLTKKIVDHGSQYGTHKNFDFYLAVCGGNKQQALILKHTLAPLANERAKNAGRVDVDFTAKDAVVDFDLVNEFVLNQDCSLVIADKDDDTVTMFYVPEQGKKTVYIHFANGHYTSLV